MVVDEWSSRIEACRSTKKFNHFLSMNNFKKGWITLRSKASINFSSCVCGKHCGLPGLPRVRKELQSCTVSSSIYGLWTFDILFRIIMSIISHSIACALIDLASPVASSFAPSPRHQHLRCFHLEGTIFCYFSEWEWIRKILYSQIISRPHV